MTVPAPAEKPKARFRPFALAPWLAAAAMAAFWLRRKKSPGAPTVPPPPMTPAQWEAAEPGRGRLAQAPWAIPPVGWKDILWRAYRELARTRLPFIAGGVTFYVLLATFPAIAAFVSLYGIFSDVHSVERQLNQMSAVFPRDATALIGGQMMRLASQRNETLSAAFAASTLVSIWSANAGMNALFNGINIAYGETEKRNYFQLTLLTYGATLAATVFLTVVAAATVAAPVLFHDVGLHGLRYWWLPLRWVGVYLMAAIVFTLVYRYGPSRARARWRWVFPGGLAAALFWMAGSLGFSWYVNNFTHFGVTYGSLGAMIGFMLWVWFSIIVILAGAELNSEIEHQTARDTTSGVSRPSGERGAVMADTVGRAFTVSPHQAGTLAAGFVRRQVRAVGGLLGRLLGR
ncbi:MAG TPA: YihY/virulence factor BrkB family protein [Caulobacteraceae bacterium]|nr:YihY/virulence factor BrkB family protein [Caulobacteraceae bacterium]